MNEKERGRGLNTVELANKESIFFIKFQRFCYMTIGIVKIDLGCY